MKRIRRGLDAEEAAGMPAGIDSFGLSGTAGKSSLVSEGRTSRELVVNPGRGGFWFGMDPMAIITDFRIGSTPISGFPVNYLFAPLAFLHIPWPKLQMKIADP